MTESKNKYSINSRITRITSLSDLSRVHKYSSSKAPKLSPKSSNSAFRRHTFNHKLNKNDSDRLKPSPIKTKYNKYKKSKRYGIQ